MNLLNISKYCFDPSEFEGDPLSQEEDETRWQIKFISRYNRANLYTDLVHYHQQLLEKTLAVVQKEYEGCINFARRVRSISERLNQKRDSLSHLSSLIPKASVTNLEELQRCLNELIEIEDKRRQLKINLSQHEAEHALVAFDSNLPDYAQALAGVFLSSLLGKQRQFELRSKIVQFLMRHLNNEKSLDHVHFFYRALRVLVTDMDVEESIELESASAIDLNQLVSQAKSRMAFIVDNDDRESVDIVMLVLTPHINQSVKTFFSELDEMTADRIALKIRTVKNNLIIPLEKWLGIKLGHFFNVLLGELNISPSLYRSVRQAEMQRRLEESIVLSKRSQNEIHIERCPEYCCSVYNNLLDNYKLCCIDDVDLTDLRSCLIPLTSRYYTWVIEEFKRWCGDINQCVRLSIKNWILIEDCCKCLKRQDRLKDILNHRLNGLFKDVLKCQLSKIFCKPNSFSTIENLPTMLVKRHGFKDNIKAQQYVDEAFVQLREWFESFPVDMAEFLIIELISTYKLAIQRAMQAVNQIRTGLAKLNKGKRQTELEDGPITLQVKADINRFVENVKELYKDKTIPASVDSSLASLCASISLYVHH